MKDGTIELELAGEKYPFRLGMGELRELQDRCTRVCPTTKIVTAQGFPVDILNRLSGKGWAIDDVVWTLKLGLQGAGMNPIDVNHIIERDVEKDMMAHAQTAMLVLYKALDSTFNIPGDSDEEKEPKKEEAAGEPLG